MRPSHCVQLSPAPAETRLFFEVSLCLSQACLGKMIVFGIRWRKRRGFLPEKTVAALPWLEKPRAERDKTNQQEENKRHRSIHQLVFQMTSLSQFEVYLGEAVNVSIESDIQSQHESLPFAAAAAAAVLSYLGCC